MKMTTDPLFSETRGNPDQTPNTFKHCLELIKAKGKPFNVHGKQAYYYAVFLSLCASNQINTVLDR